MGKINKIITSSPSNLRKYWARKKQRSSILRAIHFTFCQKWLWCLHYKRSVFRLHLILPSLSVLCGAFCRLASYSGPSRKQRRPSRSEIIQLKATFLANDSHVFWCSASMCFVRVVWRKVLKSQCWHMNASAQPYALSSFFLFLSLFCSGLKQVLRKFASKCALAIFDLVRTDSVLTSGLSNTFFCFLGLGRKSSWLFIMWSSKVCFHLVENVQLWQ